MLTTLTLLALAAADPAPAKKPPITPEDTARYYRAIARIERARSAQQQAQIEAEAAAKEVRALIDEKMAAGCVLVENDKGLDCAEKKPEAKK